MPTFDLNLFIIGVIGGALPDAIRIVKARYRSHIPAYLKQGAFWLGFALLLLLGGVAAWLLGAQHGKEALLMGFAAPELFSRLAAKAGGVDRGAEHQFGLREWWSN